MNEFSAPRCAFCGKDRAEVKRLIEGEENVYICDACILLGAEILAEEGVITGGVRPAVASGDHTPRTIPSPRAIVQHLDQYVIGPCALDLLACAFDRDINGVIAIGRLQRDHQWRI